MLEFPIQREVDGTYENKKATASTAMTMTAKATHRPQESQVE